jgi:uncharacterized glyoxalase superfamily protein PhnB
MVKNRSVPPETVLPHLYYQNVAEALDWLGRTFGFVENFRYGEPGGPVEGAQMYLGNAWIMLGSVRPGRGTPAQLGHGTQSLTIFMDDVDSHYDRVRKAGAKIVEQLNETPYGERQYAVLDLDGHHWLFSKHVRDVSPEEWGAVVPKGARKE